MLQDLNWRTLEQQPVDTQLTLMNKITFDLVAMPAADYPIPNTRQTRRNYPLAYIQRLFNTSTHSLPAPIPIVRWNVLPFDTHVLSTVAQFSHAVCHLVIVSL